MSEVTRALIANFKATDERRHGLIDRLTAKLEQAKTENAELNEKLAEA